MGNLVVKIDEMVSTELKLAHLQKLANTMAPDCKEWAFNGDVEEDTNMRSRCICGHPIKWIFWLQRTRDGRRLPIGSTCITSSVPFLISHGAEGLAKDLMAAQSVWRQLMAERMRETREGKTNCVLEKIRQDARELHAWYTNLLHATEQMVTSQNRRLPYRTPYFYQCGYRELLTDGQESTAGRKVAGIRRKMERFRTEVVQIKRCWQRADCMDVWTDPPQPGS